MHRDEADARLSRLVSLALNGNRPDLVRFARDTERNVEEYVPLAKDAKSAIIDDYATHEGDTGSPEVQIALLTERIKSLTDHLRSVPERQPLAPRPAQARRAAPAAAGVPRAP